MEKLCKLGYEAIINPPTEALFSALYFAKWHPHQTIEFMGAMGVMGAKLPWKNHAKKV